MPQRIRAGVVCNGESFIYVFHRGEWNALLDAIANQVHAAMLCPLCAAAFVAYQAREQGLPLKEFLALARDLEIKLAKRMAIEKQ